MLLECISCSSISSIWFWDARTLIFCTFKNNSIFVSWIIREWYRWRNIDHLKHKLLIATAIDESLYQELLYDEEEDWGLYLGKLYNWLYIQMKACCTNFKLFFYSFGRLLSNVTSPGLSAWWLPNIVLQLVVSHLAELNCGFADITKLRITCI